MKAFTFACLFFMAVPFAASAQFGNLKEKFKQKVTDRVDRKVDRAMEQSLDSVEAGVKPQPAAAKPAAPAVAQPAVRKEPPSPAGSAATSFASYSKFDFVPGEKVLAVEDFSRDNTGDFPAGWATDASGEVVTVQGQEGKWLKLTQNGVFRPEFINRLDSNFTLEFDVVCDPKVQPNERFFVVIGAQDKVQNTPYNLLSTGLLFSLEPNADGSENSGATAHQSRKPADELAYKVAEQRQFYPKGKNRVHVAVWRQKNRVRLYLNEDKVWDLPTALAATARYNTIYFENASRADNQGNFYLSNIRLAAGAPDTRNKLIKEGRWVTTGILFDVNSDRIRPESYGTLKEIASVIREGGNMKVKIIGHTDSDGDDKANLDLSKRRAEAVKKALGEQFGVDASGLSCDGLGESKPVADNNTPAGKAQNRRVEFVRL